MSYKYMLKSSGEITDPSGYKVTQSDGKSTVHEERPEHLDELQWEIQSSELEYQCRMPHGVECSLEIQCHDRRETFLIQTVANVGMQPVECVYRRVMPQEAKLVTKKVQCVHVCAHPRRQYSLEYFGDAAQI